MTTPDDPYAGQPAPEHGATPEQPLAPPQQPVHYGQPPAPYYYGPPQQQKPPSRVAWFFIGAGSMFAVGAVGVIGFFMLMGMVLGEEFGDFEDGYYYVDQTAVIDAVEGPCSNMRSAAYEIHLFATPEAGAKDIRRYTQAIKGIVDAIDANKPNSDARQWRDDWIALGAALDTYADDLVKDGERAAFHSMTEDDEPTISRMSYGSEADCEVPQVIEGLDPDLADYWD